MFGKLLPSGTPALLFHAGAAVDDLLLLLPYTAADTVCSSLPRKPPRNNANRKPLRTSSKVPRSQGAAHLFIKLPGAGHVLQATGAHLRLHLAAHLACVLHLAQVAGQGGAGEISLVLPLG